MSEVPEPRPWKAAALWLAFLGPFFFASYGLANWLAGRRAGVGSVAFDWERHIPFLAWTILPYWSIDLFYAVSPFVCSTRRELSVHCRRLLAAQLLCVACFLAFPLRFSFTRPAADGLFGALFTALAGFDKPFNQAPSLHIALLVILFVAYFCGLIFGIAAEIVFMPSRNSTASARPRSSSATARATSSVSPPPRSAVRARRSSPPTRHSSRSGCTR